MGSASWKDVAGARRKWADQTSAASQAATEVLVEAARLEPGLRILDIASGAGEPALTLASLVGSQGQVTATDPEAEMLAAAEQRAAARGITNLTCRPATAESLPFPEESFDRVTCRFGIMFFGNVPNALSEIRRVLKPGGRAVFVAWGPWDRSVIFTSTLGVAVRYLPEPVDVAAVSQFRFAESGKLAAALHAAGFVDVHEELRGIPWRWPGTAAEFWQCLQETAASTREVFGRIPPEKHDQVDREVLAGLPVDSEAFIVLGWGEKARDAQT